MEQQQGQAGGLEVETGRLMSAAVLIGVGGLVAFIGLVVGALHALSEGLRRTG